jgi:hypothetical protein
LCAPDLAASCGELGQTVAVATADPCVNRVFGRAHGNQLIKRPGRNLLTFANRSSLSFFPNPNTIHNPQPVFVPASFIHQPPAHSSHNWTARNRLPSNQQSRPTPCRLHTDTTQGCRMPRSHLSAAVLNEGTAAVVAMAQLHLQAANRSALVSPSLLLTRRNLSSLATVAAARLVC